MHNTVDIVYYTDPLCCWSWGLEKNWSRLKVEYENKISWKYCMGGLLPDWKHYRDDRYCVTRPVQMGAIWMEASHLTQTEIRNRIWIDDPPSSSYVSCIAVKSAGLQSADAEERYLHALRTAVMCEGRNISFAAELIAIAQELAAADNCFAVDLDRFADDLKNGNALEAFRADLLDVQRKGIHRFPTMLMRSASHPPIMLTGYRPYESLCAAVESMM